jgi:P27 family predicted phage terminase small subunit
VKRGPKQQASETAALKGNPGHRPIAPVADVAQIAEIAPDWLKGKDARAIWSKLMPQLRQLRFVKETDEIVVGRYCIHLARFLTLNDDISTKGKAAVTYTTVTNHGTMERLHPKFAALMRTEEALVKIEDRIGLTPAARQSLMSGLANRPAGDIPPTGLTDPRQPQRPSSPVGLLAALDDAPAGYSN